MTQTCIVYHIDRNNNFIDANDAWDEFALANNAPHLVRKLVCRHSLFDLISDPQCNHLYKLLIERIKHTGKPIDFEFRCDSPEMRRFMHMEMIHQAGNGVVCFKSTVQRQEPRDPVALLDPDNHRSTERVIICSWCKNIKIGDNQWVEIEEGVDRLGLFSTDYLPQLSHAICPACNESVWRELVK
jgi:hypothetical protein